MSSSLNTQSVDTQEKWWAAISTTTQQNHSVVQVPLFTLAQKLYEDPSISLNVISPQFSYQAHFCQVFF